MVIFLPLIPNFVSISAGIFGMTQIGVTAATQKLVSYNSREYTNDLSCTWRMSGNSPRSLTCHFWPSPRADLACSKTEWSRWSAATCKPTHRQPLSGHFLCLVFQQFPRKSLYRLLWQYFHMQDALPSTKQTVLKHWRQIWQQQQEACQYQTQCMTESYIFIYFYFLHIYLFIFFHNMWVLMFCMSGLKMPNHIMHTCIHTFIMHNSRA